MVLMSKLSLDTQITVVGEHNFKIFKCKYKGHKQYKQHFYVNIKVYGSSVYMSGGDWVPTTEYALKHYCIVNENRRILSMVA